MSEPLWFILILIEKICLGLDCKNFGCSINRLPDCLKAVELGMGNTIDLNAQT